MTADERLELARKLIRASLALPNNHPAQTSLDAAVADLMAKATTTPTPERAAS